MVGKFERTTKDHYTLKEIERAVRFRDLMYTYAERGDLESIHLVVDAESAIAIAKPTALQELTIKLVWRENRTLVEAGKMLGVTPQAVKFNLDLFKVKLQKVLDSWKQEDKTIQHHI